MGIYRDSERRTVRHVGILLILPFEGATYMYLVDSNPFATYYRGFVPSHYYVFPTEYFLIDEKNHLVSDWESETYGTVH